MRSPCIEVPVDYHPNPSAQPFVLECEGWFLQKFKKAELVDSYDENRGEKNGVFVLDTSEEIVITVIEFRLKVDINIHLPMVNGERAFWKLESEGCGETYNVARNIMNTMFQ